MSIFKKLFFIAALSLCVHIPANATDGDICLKSFATIWVTGTIAMDALGCYYSYQAREKVLHGDPDSNFAKHSERGLMGSVVNFGMSAGLLGLALAPGAVGGQNGAAIATILTVTAVFPNIIAPITTTVAYAIEDNHQYSVNSNTASVWGSSDSNLKIAMGLSWAALVANIIGIASYMVLAK